MSIKNFIDKSIIVDSSESVIQTTVNAQFTGAINVNSTLLFNKIGNLCLMTIPPVFGLSTGTGTTIVANNVIPSNFLPIDSFIIESVSMNADHMLGGGNINISNNGTISIGTFSSIEAGQNIGFASNIGIPYICS